VQSDLYALGLVLYELFTGKKAFDASSLAELHRRQTETAPKPPSSVVKNFDPICAASSSSFTARSPPRTICETGSSEMKWI
jgi:serine/threonine protein kinase